jgi:hypothetical protein
MEDLVMAEETTLDQEVDLAMAFLLGFAAPRYHSSPLILNAWRDLKPSLPSLTYATFLWNYVGDLQPSIDRFKVQIEAFAKEKAEFPCILLSGDPPLPIDPKAIPNFDISPLGPEFHTEAETPKVNVEMLSIKKFQSEEVPLFFMNRLASFLRTRLSSQAGISGNVYTSPSGVPPGLLFRVTTLTRGLRVHYTHQYYVNPTYVFGAPTTPVDSYIQPGRWYFGTSVGSSSVTMDFSAVYDVPNVSSAHLNV